MSQGARGYPLTSALLAEMHAEFSHFRIVDKAGNTFWTLIDWALRLVTFGAQRHYLTRYHTVIGDTLYVCGAWHSMSDVARVILLRHERVHLRQRRRYGMPLFAALYLLPFLPLGLAYGRARLEWEAYTETLRATAELRGIEALADSALRREIVRRFVSGDYGWMWPFSRTIERWYDQVVRQLVAAAEQPPAGPTSTGSADGSERI
jgi:hypothetical protein